MSTDLTKIEAKKEIESALKEKGCYDIYFPDSNGDNTLTVLFNCKELTSFKYSLSGWEYSGIQLDETKERQYKIAFYKKA